MSLGEILDQFANLSDSTNVPDTEFALGKIEAMTMIEMAGENRPP